MSQPSIRTTCLLACVSVAVCACGGKSESALGVSLDPGQNLASELFLPGTIPQMYLYGSFTGDLHALRGKTIWFWLEDPDDLVEAIDPFIVDDRWGLGVTWKKPAPGHHSGSMALWISFDEEEKQQLAGSPLAIPYDVAVVSLLDVDPTPLTITTTFADPIQTRTVQLGLNAGTRSWGATLDLATEPGQPFVPQACAFTAAGGLTNPGPPYGSVPMVTCTADGMITLAFLPEPPGTYDGTLYVQAVVEYEGQEYRVEKEISLTYTVVASGQVTAFSYPAETHLTGTQGYGILGARYRLLLDEGITCDRSRKQIEYLSHPPEADGNIHADGWWTEDPHQAALLFDLPAGTYQARVRYPISVDGVESWLDHPVTLDIVPP